jgi:hypothetical protein
MLNPEKHCEMLSANVRDRSEAMRGGFRLFIQLFSALVAGVIVLRVNPPNNIPAGFVFLSDLLACFIVVASVILVWDSFRAWYGQRTKLSQVAGTNGAGELVIPPIHPSSFITFSIMIGVMFAALILFYFFNPLRN